MLRRYWMTLLSAALALALPCVSEAGIELDTVGGTQTVECGGQSVEVNGMSSDLTLLGDCPHVEVNGSGNTVRIERARKIEINGMSNKVIWERGPNGERPSIETGGPGNSTRQGRVAAADGEATAGAGRATTSHAPGKPAPASASRSEKRSAIVIEENRRTQTIACTGNDVTVDGNHNTLSFTGECGHVAVNGNGNVVQLEVVAAISALGNENTITWRKGAGEKAPKVESLGSKNDISRLPE